MDYRDQTIDEFAARLACGAPVPGGGTAAALTGALAASLSAMVAALTEDKAGYEVVSEEMRAAGREALALQNALLDGMQRDSDAFDEYMHARALPASVPDEKAARRARMQAALKDAARVPYETALNALSVMPWARLVALKGNKNCASDALSAALLARCAVRLALMNVQINVASIKDEAFCAQMRAEIDRISALAEQLENEILSATNRVS